jgi:hypothetical protein
MKRSHVIPSLPALACALALFAPACSTTASGRGSTETAAEEAGKDEDEAADKAEELAKKKFELECARLELQVKKLDTEAETRSMQHEIEDAERELRDAQEKLQAFTTFERAQKLDDKKLDLDQALQRKKEQEQELDELKAMYKQEELATLTKELVMSRETAQIGFAQRRLELEQKAAEHLNKVEVPRTERELTEGVQVAERKLQTLRAKSEKQQLEARLQLMKAEREIQDAEKEIAKLEKKLKAAA